MAIRLGALVAVAAAWAACASPARAAGPKVDLASPTDLPHVGLRISLPANQKPEISGKATTALVARAGYGKRWQSRTVVEVTRERPDRPGPKPRTVAEAFLPQVRRAGGYEKSVFVASAPLQVEAQAGWLAARTFSKGRETMAGVVLVWTGPFPKYDVSLRYVVYFQWNGPDAETAVRVAKAMGRSIRHIPLRSPSDLHLPPLLGPVAYPADRLVIGIPFGWYVLPLPPQDRKTKMVMLAAVSDYVYGLSAPEMSVQVQRGVTQIPDFSAMDDDGLEAYLNALRRRKSRRTRWKHVRHRRVWMVGRTGVELIGARRVGKQPVLEVVRQVFDSGDLYTLTLVWRGGDVRLASAAMLRLSLGLRFVPRPKPQTQPATAPAD